MDDAGALRHVYDALSRLLGPAAELRPLALRASAVEPASSWMHKAPWWSTVGASRGYQWDLAVFVRAGAADPVAGWIATALALLRPSGLALPEGTDTEPPAIVLTDLRVRALPPDAIPAVWWRADGLAGWLVTLCLVLPVRETATTIDEAQLDVRDPRDPTAAEPTPAGPLPGQPRQPFRPGDADLADMPDLARQEELRRRDARRWNATKVRSPRTTDSRRQRPDEGWDPSQTEPNP